jgi:gluconolactonase
VQEVHSSGTGDAAPATMMGTVLLSSYVVTGYIFLSGSPEPVYTLKSGADASDAGLHATEIIGRASDGIVWTEGPLWLDGRLLFTDTVEASIWSWSEGIGLKKERAQAGGCGGNPLMNNTRISPFEVKLRKMHPHTYCPRRDGRPTQHERGPNGLAYDPRTRLIINCQHGGRRVVRLGASRLDLIDVLAASYDGHDSKRADHIDGHNHPLNSPNDVTLHPDGSIFFTDPYYGFLDRKQLHLGDHNYTSDRSALGFAGVFRVPPPTEVGSADISNPHLVTDELSRPNGIQIEPGTSALWVSECCQGHSDSCPEAVARWYRYEADPGTHENYVRTRTIEWTRPGGGGGCSDGFKLLSRPDGRAPLIVSACPLGVCIVDTGKADNHVVQYVDFAKRVSNVAFGGDGFLYVTGDGHLWRAPLAEEAQTWAADQAAAFLEAVRTNDPTAKSEL